MKHAYIKPIITRVKLDPEQAILQACIVGGAYLAFLYHTFCADTRTAPGPRCSLTPKGGAGGSTNMTNTYSSAPS